MTRSLRVVLYCGFVSIIFCAVSSFPRLGWAVGDRSEAICKKVGGDPEVVYKGLGEGQFRVGCTKAGEGKQLSFTLLCEYPDGYIEEFKESFFCKAPSCGDNIVDLGEQCGEPGLTCPSGQTCNTITCQCSGGGGGPSGGQCTPAHNNWTCDGTNCQGWCDPGLTCQDALAIDIPNSPGCGPGSVIGNGCVVASWLIHCGLCCNTCGDGTVGPGEECDDRNTESGDGCSSTCKVERPKCSAAETEKECPDTKCQQERTVESKYPLNGVKTAIKCYTCSEPLDPCTGVPKVEGVWARQGQNDGNCAGGCTKLVSANWTGKCPVGTTKEPLVAQVYCCTWKNLQTCTPQPQCEINGQGQDVRRCCVDGGGKNGADCEEGTDKRVLVCECGGQSAGECSLLCP